MTTRPNLFRSFALLLIGGILVLASPVRGAVDPTGFSSDKLERVAQLLKEAVDQNRIAGASALIARQGKIVYLATTGMQDVAAKISLTESTLFRLASMTKPVTAAAVMILVDEGKLSVTDPLSKYLPEFKDLTVLVPSQDRKSYELVKATREITLHDLLTHTSGLTYSFTKKPFVSQMYVEAHIAEGLVETPDTLEENVRKLAKLPLVCQPGARWEYGLGLDVLGRVIEVVSGKTLAEFCRERIFAPLGMNDTGFFLPKEKWSRLSALYTPGPDHTLIQLGTEPVSAGTFSYSATVPLHEDGCYCSGGGGLVSTLGDYYRFCQMLLNAGQRDGVRVLKPESAARMMRNQIGDLRIGRGEAFMGYGGGIVAGSAGNGQAHDPAGTGSYFWGGAFYTTFWIDPEAELIGIVMAQRFPPEGSPGNEVLGRDFKRLTYEALLKRPSEKVQVAK